MSSCSHENQPSGGPARTARGRSPALLLLLAFAVLTFLATLPWQMRQWQETARLREEASLQERRLQDLRAKHEGVRSAEQRLKDAPADVGALLESARNCIDRGDNARALRLLRQAETTATTDLSLRDNPALITELSGLYERMGWQDKAFTLARRAVQLAPESVEALMRLAFLETAIGWQDSGLQHAETAARLAPSLAEPHLVMALIAEQGGAMDKAESELITASRLRSADWHILLLLARNRLSQRQYDDALATIDTAQRHAPAEPSLFSTRADTLLKKAKDRSGIDRAGLKKALEVIRQYQRLAPDSREAPFLAGLALRELGDIPGALREWQAVYAVYPDFPGLRNNLGLLLVRQGHTEAGRRMLAEGKALTLEASEFNRLVTAASRDLENPEPHRTLARWAQAQERLPRAILEWEQVLRLRPRDAEAIREHKNCLTRREEMTLRARTPLPLPASSP